MGGGVAEALSESNLKKQLFRDQESEVASPANFAGDVEMGSVFTFFESLLNWCCIH